MKQLEDGMFVSGQIAIDDVAILAAQGVRTLINNRPDGEVPGQPTGAAIRQAAEAAGLAYVDVPMSQLTGEGVAAMRQALDAAETPVLAFCASGTRSTYLWALARSGELSAEAIEAGAAGAGYDLTPVRRFL